MKHCYFLSLNVSDCAFYGIIMLIFLQGTYLLFTTWEFLLRRVSSLDLTGKFSSFYCRFPVLFFIHYLSNLTLISTRDCTEQFQSLLYPSYAAYCATFMSCVNFQFGINFFFCIWSALYLHFCQKKNPAYTIIRILRKLAIFPSYRV